VLEDVEEKDVLLKAQKKISKTGKYQRNRDLACEASFNLLF